MRSSGLNAAEQTRPSWPRRTTGSPLPSARQTRAVLSPDAVTMRVAVRAERGRD